MSGQRLWKRVYNVFPQYWSPSIYGTEAGPEDLAWAQIWVDVPEPNGLEELVWKMKEQPYAKAVIVGQRGVGKSTQMAALASRLASENDVSWIDAISHATEILQDPIELFAACALVAYQRAKEQEQDLGEKRLQKFLAACWETTIESKLAGQHVKLNVSKALSELARVTTGAFATVALATGAPFFWVAAGIAEAAHLLFEWVDVAGEESQSRTKERKVRPRTDVVAAELSKLVREVEGKLGRPIIFLVDGLDRLETGQLRALFERARDLARPEVRLILTAPMVLYNKPEFVRVGDFLSTVVVPNVGVGGPSGQKGQRFLKDVVEKRLQLCGVNSDQIFERGVLDSLVEASGGNVRQLNVLVRGLSYLCSYRQRSKANLEDAKEATAGMRRQVVDPLTRQEYLQEMQAFYRGQQTQPSMGQVGDELLDAQALLVYRDAGAVLRYELNPPVREYLAQL